MKLNSYDMRTSIRLLLTIFIITILLSCYGNGDNKLFVTEKKGLYGYVNAKGDIIIDCVYPLVYTDTISKIGFVADSTGHIKCFNNKGKYLVDVFKYDNGPDYPREGLFRIVDNTGLIGFADTLGNIIITPKYKFAYPFTDGKAKVTDRGRLIIDSEDFESHEYWQSDKWFLIPHKKK